jgi:pimeloyl-ACP methyl ester carboxylesterase
MSALNFTDQGNGTPILLLHGFPFNQDIWKEFSEKLSKSLRVITIDLPGFGRSSIEQTKPFSIEYVARVIIDWIRAKGLGRLVLVGHSLGGYVALSMAEQQANLFQGLVLFHSTALADSEEKKQSRNKVLDFIENNGVHAFTSSFILPLYADQKHPSINKVREIATQTEKETVILYTQAMRDRKDRTAVLREFPSRILFIAGEKDQAIPKESVEKQASLNKLSSVHIMAGVGHMGMFENPQEAIDVITEFVNNSNRH